MLFTIIIEKTKLPTLNKCNTIFEVSKKHMKILYNFTNVNNVKHIPLLNKCKYNNETYYIGFQLLSKVNRNLYLTSRNFNSLVIFGH